MVRPKNDFDEGSSTIQGYFDWINDRHAIYLRRAAGEPKPWTEDEVFLDWKFTNAFRQLDRGTIALQDMIKKWKDEASEIKTMLLEEQQVLILFNVVWYRMFNRDDHAHDLGFATHYKQVEEYINECADKGVKVFTGAHLLAGIQGERKHISFLRTIEEAWDDRYSLLKLIQQYNGMEQAFGILLDYPLIGNFLAYEMVCDFRFTDVMPDPHDKMTWSNIGPGARRGMKRIGLEVSVETMVRLLAMAPQYLRGYVLEQKDPPFELREIEHSLCEFDKYERIRLGQGRARGVYDGRG